MAYLYCLTTEVLMYKLPFEDITKEEYYNMMETLQLVDIAKIEEDDDETDLSGELACAGGACEIT